MTGNHQRSNNNAKRTERLRKTVIEQILEHLPEDIVSEFKHFTRFNQRSSDIQKWLSEVQYEYHSHFPENWIPVTPSISNVTYWLRKTYPVGEKAQILNALTDGYVGLDYEQVLQSSLAQSVQLCMQLTERLEREGVDDIAPEQVLAQVAALQRTISSLYKDIQRSNTFNTIRDAEMAGAQRLVDIMINQFKDQASEEVVRQACIGALKQIEHEVYSAP